MFKSTENGVVKQGKEWDLTDDDRFELMISIVEETNVELISKSSGRWSQAQPLGMIEPGYRIFSID